MTCVFDQTTHWQYDLQYDTLYPKISVQHAGLGVAIHGWVGGIECTNGVEKRAKNRPGKFTICHSISFLF